MRASDWERLRAVFVQVFDEPELGVGARAVSATTSAQDVDAWDSVTHVVLLVAIEREFGLRFAAGEMADLTDVGELVARIERRLDAADRASGA